MKNYNILQFILIAIIVFTTGCSSVEPPTYTPLPAGMATGLWVTSSGDMGIALFKGGVMGVFKDGILGVCYEYGEYNLTNENTVTVKSGNNHVAALKIDVSQDGKKIVVESDATHLNDSFQLKIADTSSGDLRKDMIGTWKLVDTSLSGASTDNMIYQFGADGNMAYASNNKSGTASWDLIGGKLVITLVDPVSKKDTILYVSSLGDLLMLYDNDSPTITLLLRQK